MRIAIVGAGIAGVTLAHELSSAGHEVLVLERHASVAGEGSFANAGLLAPDLVQPWSATPRGSTPAGLHLAPTLPWLAAPSLLRLPWLWRGWRLRRGPQGTARHTALRELARCSQQLQQALVEQLAPEFEHTQGVLLLLRQPRAARSAQAALAAWPADLPPPLWLDADAARALEPALNPRAALAGAVHLPQAGAGNCRQFAHALKGQAQRRGVRFLFGRAVTRVHPGRPLRLDLAGTDPIECDAAVLCSGLDSAALLRPMGLRLPLQPLRSGSITAPLRPMDDAEAPGPRATVVDLHTQTVITRLGDRVRASGGAALGPGTSSGTGTVAPAHLQALHAALDHWFPAAATTRLAQHWQGASPTLPDGLPLLGPSGHDNLWLNLGHGSHGWVLACGAARLLRAQMEGTAPPVNPQPFGVDRF